MNATSARLWREAALPEDYEEPDDPWNGMPRCPTCGCFLTLKPEDQGFDTVLDEYYESRTCKRCQRVVQELVY